MRKTPGQPWWGLAGGLLVGFACFTTLAAHDFWITPSLFSPPTGTLVSFELRVGDHFRGTIFPRRSSHVESFRVTGPDGQSWSVPGLEGRSPAGHFRFRAPGLHIVTYRSTSSLVSLEPVKFRAYLKEEGLERFAPFSPDPSSEAPIRETFSRCAKTLLQVDGEAAPLSEDRRIGLPLELVTHTNPYLLLGGGELEVTLHLQDGTLEDALIVALHGSSGERLEARSDGDGRATFELTPGVWLLKAVHIAAAEANEEHDWESVWASLTFEIPTSR